MKRFSILFTLLMIVAIIAAACAPAAASPPQVVEKQVPVEVTKIVAGTPQVVVVTATPDIEQAYAHGRRFRSVERRRRHLPRSGLHRMALCLSVCRSLRRDQLSGDRFGRRQEGHRRQDHRLRRFRLAVDRRRIRCQPHGLQMFPTLAGAEVIDLQSGAGSDHDPGAGWPDAGRHLHGQDHQVERSGDQGAESRRQPARQAYHRRAPLRWFRHDRNLHQVPGRRERRMEERPRRRFSQCEWPVDKAGNGIGGKGNAGVAAAVQNTPYSIGYVELSYAVANKIAFADMVNKAGKTVKANAESLASAMADYRRQVQRQADHQPASAMVRARSRGRSPATPIRSSTWIRSPIRSWVVPRPRNILNWVHWSLTDAGAAKRASDLGYATLPETVRAKVFETLAQGHVRRPAGEF